MEFPKKKKEEINVLPEDDKTLMTKKCLKSARKKTNISECMQSITVSSELREMS